MSGGSLDFTRILFETIDMRSFSNLWFWIALAVVWSTASHWVLGVPFDMIARAKRHGGQAEADLDTLAEINVRRILHVVRVSGLWLLGFVAFALTTLGVLAFWYGVEFAQAVVLMALPLTLVGALAVRAAVRIEAGGERGEALRRRLLRQRLATQVVGMVSIFVTAMWGMYQNLDVPPGF